MTSKILSVKNSPGFLQGESDHSRSIARGLKDLGELILLLVRVWSVSDSCSALWQVYRELLSNRKQECRYIPTFNCNNTLFCGKLSSSLARKTEAVVAIGFIDYQDPTFQVEASYRFMYREAVVHTWFDHTMCKWGAVFVARFCSPPELHKTGIIPKHWNRTTKHAYKLPLNQKCKGVCYLFTTSLENLPWCC